MEGTFGDTLTAIAARHDVPVKSIQLDRTGGMRATAKRGHITYGPDLNNQPAAIQRWVAAHELAHVARRHGRYWAIQGLAIAVVVLAFVAIIVCLYRPGPVALIVAIVSVAVAVRTAIWTSKVISETQEQQEDEADAQAAAWGYDVTPTIANWLASVEEANGVKPGDRRRRHAHPHDRITSPGERNDDMNTTDRTFSQQGETEGGRR